MKKFRIGDLFDNRKFLVVFSVVFAVLAWISVAMTTSQTIEDTVREIPVDLTLVQESLGNLGLSVLEGTDQVVNVVVRGQRTVVGQLGADDLTVTATLRGITEAGLHDLPLTAVSNGTADFEVVRINPSTIRVRLDTLETRSFEIVPDAKGISTPPDYMFDPEQVSPSTVNISGPATELDKVDKVTVEVELEEPLTRTYAANLPIKVYDVEGAEIHPEERFLTLERDEAQLSIRVFRIKDLPLEVGFIYPPTGFPLEELKELMQLSETTVQVAGPPSVIDNYNELRVGYIDIRTLTVENNTFQFDVTMPSDQFSNLSDVQSVTVEFDSLYWDEAVFNLTDIQLINMPTDYDVELMTSALYGVRIVGDELIIADLSADDIVVEVDLSQRELTEGQYNLSSVRISIPSKGLVWAVGEQQVAVRVTESGG